MGALHFHKDGVPSDLETFLAAHPSPSRSLHPPYLHTLALQIAHSLRYQHNWTQLHIHYNIHTSSVFDQRLPRPILSGLPPRRLYTHPDEQIAILQRQRSSGKTKEQAEPLSEREWVVPSHLREKWSLRHFGEMFDRIGAVPPELVHPCGVEDMTLFQDPDKQMMQTHSEHSTEWRTTKRFLLSTLEDDGTIVFYIVHDGIVKPRQN